MLSGKKGIEQKKAAEKVLPNFFQIKKIEGTHKYIRCWGFEILTKQKKC